MSAEDEANILESLSPDEREAALRIMQQADLDGPEKVLGPILGMEYERDVVPVRQWLEDDYHMGEMGKSLYPKLKDDFVSLFEGESHEVILSGSIGWGKTHFAKLATVRSIYELSCLREPQRSMGLSPDSLISLVAISVKVDIAKRSILDSIAQMMVLSPYFMREFRPSVTQEKIKFPKGIDLAPAAATNNNVLSLNTFGGILDESAFLGGMTEQQKKDMRRFGFVDRSEVLYTLLLRRMRSRYLQRGGKLPGKLFLVSSKRTTNDFIERRIRAARQESGVFIREYNKWDVKPDAFGAKRFWVMVGNEQHHSRILSDKDDPAQYRQLEGVQLHQVPEDLRASFESDLDSAIRDDLGVSTVAISPFIGRREKIEDALEQGRAHPFSAMEWEAGSIATFHWSYLVRRNPESGENEPVCCPRAARHAHIDGSLSGDATGIAVAHVHGFKDMERADRSSGDTFIERAPIVKVDFCLRIVPPPGDEIILSDVRVLIYDLAKHGMHVLYVSMDAWQSAEALQQLRQNGYRSEVVSVDRTTVPYELLKAALYEDRLLLYPYPPLQDELRRLEHDRRRGKIDHPSNGSKDVSDAVAACVYTLSSSDAAIRANLPSEALGPSLGISLDPGSPLATGDMVEGADGEMHAAEDWENDFRMDGGFGLPSTGSSGAAVTAPAWLLAGKGRVPTLPLQKGSRQIP